MPTRRNIGFTLIELSIVLVIIGLIVGGVLVGRDLITAATLRSQIRQIDQYKTAIYTFRTKYNAMPGDMSAATAAALGMAVRSGNAGEGDNDGILEASGGVCSDRATGEPLYFWTDLSSANLIDQSFTYSGPPAANTTNIGQYLPAAKIGRGGYVSVMCWSFTPGVNFFHIMGRTQILGGGVSYMWSNPFTPYEASKIDTKIDDGYPQRGVVQVSHAPSPGSMVWSGDGDNCYHYDGVSNYLYHTESASLANTPACGFHIRFN